MKYEEVSIKLAIELYEGGYDFTDISNIGYEIHSMCFDDFWKKVISGEEVAINDIESESTARD